MAIARSGLGALLRWGLLGLLLPACGSSGGGPPGPLPGSDGGPPGEAGLAPGTDAAPEGDAAAAAPATAGQVTLHRLNRAEYNNTVRDLLGTWLRPADDFPSDDRGYGFDNIADVLSLSPLQVEMYERAADALVTEALREFQALSTQLEAETVGGSVGQAAGNAWLLWANGEIAAPVKVPAPGSYKITVRAWEQHAGSEPAQLGLRLDGVLAHTIPVPALAAAPGVYERTLDIAPGTRILSVAFLNDLYEPATMLDRNLYVDWVKVEGPIGGASSNAARGRLLTCDPAAAGQTEASCAQDILGRFARKAWRRPVTADELARLVAFVELARREGDGFEAGVALGLKAILVAPQFLFRVEADPAPTGPRWLNDHELATRLAYFLWSSTPDDALLDAADAGKLTTSAAERQRQIARLLADPRSDALLDNFAGQWLETRRLTQHEVDYNAFPRFDPTLRRSLATETRMFFREFLDKPLDARQLLTADFTFLDDRLASHYGLPPVGAGWQRVSTTATPRRGVLGQGSVLTVTSYQTRTSPVRRGKWVLDQLLCTPPPPPPPGVEGLAPAAAGTATTLRQRMEAHRTQPLCMSCHTVMDPIGFGLENFDGIGAYRDTDQGQPVDASGTLPDGRPFQGAAALADLLAGDARFPACLAERVFVYALGRGVTAADRPYLDTIGSQFATSGHLLPALLTAVIESAPFRARGDAAAQEVTP